MTQFKFGTDFSHGNEVAYSCDQRLFFSSLTRLRREPSSIRKKISSGAQGTHQFDSLLEITFQDISVSGRVKGVIHFCGPVRYSPPVDQCTVGCSTNVFQR